MRAVAPVVVVFSSPAFSLDLSEAEAAAVESLMERHGAVSEGELVRTLLVRAVQVERMRELMRRGRSWN